MCGGEVWHVLLVLGVWPGSGVVGYVCPFILSAGVSLFGRLLFFPWRCVVTFPYFIWRELPLFLVFLLFHHWRASFVSQTPFSFFFFSHASFLRCCYFPFFFLALLFSRLSPARFGESHLLFVRPIFLFSLFSLLGFLVSFPVSCFFLFSCFFFLFFSPFSCLSYPYFGGEGVARGGRRGWHGEGGGSGTGREEGVAHILLHIFTTTL